MSYIIDIPLSVVIPQAGGYVSGDTSTVGTTQQQSLIEQQIQQLQLQIHQQLKQQQLLQQQQQQQQQTALNVDYTAIPPSDHPVAASQTSSIGLDLLLPWQQNDSNNHYIPRANSLTRPSANGRLDRQLGSVRDNNISIPNLPVKPFDMSAQDKTDSLMSFSSNFSTPSFVPSSVNPNQNINSSVTNNYVLDEEIRKLYNTNVATLQNI